MYRQGFLAAILKMGGDADSEATEFEMQLRRAGAPTVAIEMKSPEELGVEIFKWEIVKVLACVPLNVNPFDEPDVQESREKVSAVLEEMSSKRERPARPARAREGESNSMRKRVRGCGFRL
jgi:transaldolase / glucose-6-phosphate isomerase